MISRTCQRSIALRNAAAILVAIGACYDLPDVGRGVCGNGVVEFGEDCDRFPDPMHTGELTCNASCRYSCVASDPHCPDGWGCGVDGVCRHGTAQFTIDGPIALPSTTLIAAPLDGDGHTQVIGMGGSTAGVLRGDPYPVSLLRVAEPSTCAARSLDGGPRASLLTSTGNAIVGWNTSADRGFQPLLTIERTPDDLDPTTPAADVAELGARVFPLRTGQSPTHPIAFFALQAADGLRLGTLSPPVTTRLAAVTGQLSQLVPHPAIGNVDGGAGDELAIGFVGGDTVWVIGMTSTACSTNCSACVGTRCELDTPTVIATLAIPDVGDRLVFGDVDNDGKLDLLVVLRDGKVAVARGNGAGAFGPATIDARFTPDAVGACAGSATFGTTVGYPPLLARDLDGDGTTDYATADGIVLGRPGGTYCRAAFAFAASAAAVLDANGDGRTDVALVDGGVVFVETRAPNGAFDAHPIDLPGGASPRDVEVADVDGDYLDDLIVRAINAQDEPELWIAHGSPSVANLVVTPGPAIGAAISFAVGAFEHLAGSAGGIVIYGYDALTDHDFTARLAPTIGGLGSDLVFDSLDRPFDVQLGHFISGGHPSTLDLLVGRGAFVQVWPDQAEVLRNWGQSTASVPDGFRANLRVYGDIDGDGLDELCYVDDSFLQCGDLQPQWVARPAIAIGAVHDPRSGQLVDLDGDGRSDLLAAFGDGGVVVVHDVGGAARAEVISATSARGALATNLDDDPALEIVAIDDSVHFFKDTLEIGGLDQTFTDTFTGPITAADLDGNGVAELILGASADTVFVLVPETNTGPR